MSTRIADPATGFEDLVRELASMIRERLSAEEAERVAAFAERYFGNVPPLDILGRDPLDLYGSMLAHYRFACARKPGQALTRVYNPEHERHGWQSTHTVLEVCVDDMPFLVDSVANELARQHYGIHLVIHPVVRVARDEAGAIVGIGGDAPAESYLKFEIDRQTDEERLNKLLDGVRKVLDDVRAAVEDWKPMCAKMDEALVELAHGREAIGDAEYDEVVAFLNWIADNHFTFLGYSIYQLERDQEGDQLRRAEGSGLGIMRHHDVHGLRSRSFAALPADVRARAREPQPAMAITKANAKSTVHRATYLDYVGVKRYAPGGEVIGEHRFLGLFTSAAYNLSPRDIPYLRRKIENVANRPSHSFTGHAGKAMANILETFPRDELFQIDEDTLAYVSKEILHLQERQRIRLFLRADSFARFVSAIVYVPRDRYNTVLRWRIERILVESLNGTDVEFQAHLSESVLARIVFIVRTPKGAPAELDVEAVEQRIVVAAESWGDKLRAALIDRVGEEVGNRLFRSYALGFPSGYQDATPARAAVADILSMERLISGEEELSMRLYRRLEEPRGLLRFKLIRADQAIYLADALPILENMGLRVLHEEPHAAETEEGRSFALHDFGMQPTTQGDIDVEALGDDFRDAFAGAWKGRIENDGFNKLVLAAGLSARAITVLRAYCKYMLQVGSPFSQAYIERTLVTNPGLARRLAQLFEARFDPDLTVDRESAMADAEAAILEGLEQVAILDEDRIIRRFLGLIKATLRTNHFQRAADGQAKTYLSLKFDPSAVPDMPLPRPAFEIFVYAPYVEGVHLRGGKVARGGLRWSDRREDFRTEILGLMKAQMVKNGVIVPVGAKGGFVVKQPPSEGGRQAYLDEGVRCYRAFLSGLLDVTDNQKGDAVIPPERVVRHDGDDPYLVVAADKGTATFSDYANAVSESYGFWLGDAFASGGSAGYDHKGMGITAKGAWESVKQHFKEMGKDCQSEPFTVVGVGDMSGDVFGNGMLLSRQIKLIAAFDHRHVFVDPDPDPESSWLERKRLFDLGRSSWDDYDRSKLSAGGGIYPRSSKAIEISDAARRALGLDRTRFAPMELMNGILKAPVELFWNGGIGTYVKASGESHADAQDRANDGLRVDGAELRCAVVGEGGNLGCTQLGRIEFASRGGRINTDFIDNSAGVDCSDHEVNIKIALGAAEEAGDLTRKQRDALLAEMTDEVAQLCLRDNVLQNLALSTSLSKAVGMLDAQIAFIHKLEAQGRLNRELEFLPSDQALANRRADSRGLTRPEASVLLSYAKMSLYDAILQTDLPDDPYFAGDLAKYFPRPLRRRFPNEIARHRLRREIVATWLANSIVNRGLETFVSEIEDETGDDLGEIARCYVTARDSFGLIPMWAEVEALGFSVEASAQIGIFHELRSVLMDGTRWFLGRAGAIDIEPTVEIFRTSIQHSIRDLDRLLSPRQAERHRLQVAELEARGVGEELSRKLAAVPFLIPLCDVVAVAQQEEVEIDEVAKIYFALDDALFVDWLRESFDRAEIATSWDRLALSSVKSDMSRALRDLTKKARVAAQDWSGAPADEVKPWIDGRGSDAARFARLLSELETAPTIDASMLTVAVRALGDLANAE